MVLAYVSILLVAANIGTVCQAATPIIIHANDVTVTSLSPHMVGGGIEDVNHELIGGIYTQLVFGESFEEPVGKYGISGNSGRITWRNASTTAEPWDPACDWSVLTGQAYTGVQSQAVSRSGGSAGCGIVNQGLDASGVFVQAGITYSGYLFAQSSSSGFALEVSLEDTWLGYVVAKATLSGLVADGAWHQYNFTLTPNATTQCAQDVATPLVPCQSIPEGVCPGCAGALRISLDRSKAGPMYVAIDQVFIAPTGPPLAVPGQPSRADVVASILTTGSKLMPGMNYTGNIV